MKKKEQVMEQTLNLNITVKAGAENAPDYYRKECWCKIPEITKDVDTFLCLCN
ncbi:hypothetical protein IJT93_03720 [bacterium]|nr:hypothetical protein [bacterium]